MGTSTAVKASAAEKRAHALRLRRGGATYEQVAKEVGYASKGAAHKAVSTELANIPREAADELRNLELERFDAMTRPLMVRLGQGDMTVIQDLLRISDRRARLTGLWQVEPDAPHEGIKQALGGFLMDAIARERELEQQAALGEDHGNVTGIESD